MFRYSTVDDQGNSLQERHAALRLGNYNPPASTWQARVALARNWIDKCSSEHQHYRRASLPTLPRRVIQVGHGDSCLVETRGAVGRYATLSHCWKDSQPLTTTTATLRSRLGYLYVSQLPTAFQEAIEVVRLLGLQYLWIDSLCIVQDDHEEWEVEAARMASIYENAHLTIAFHQPGPNCSSLANGFDFSTQLLETLSSPDISCTLNESVPYKHVIETDHLASRGWCFRERLLSNRILHCTPFEIMFECASWRSCECYTLQGAACATDHFDRFNWKTMFPNAAMDADNWREMITLYSQKEFTYPKDVLPALSSIANRCKGLGHYYGGTWGRDFAHSQLWYGVASTLAGKSVVPLRRNLWLAPSFSWPSRSGPKAFLDLKNTGALPRDVSIPMTQTMSITSISIEPEGHNPLGNLKFGSHIQVTGRILRNVSFVNMFERPMCSRMFMRHVIEEEEQCLWATLKVTGVGHYIFHPDYPLTEFGTGDKILCLQLFASTAESSSLCYGLVLAPRHLGDQGKDERGAFLHYSRVGLFASLEKKLFKILEPTSIKIA